MTFTDHDSLPPLKRRHRLPGTLAAAAALSAVLLTQSATFAPQAAHAAPSSSQSIVVLVNDEPITGYEVDQRVKLALLGASDLQKRLQAKLKSPNINDKFKAFAIKRLKANPPKTEAEQQSRVKQLQAEFVQSLKREVEADFRPQARKNALDELIEERLKLQEAKRMDVVAGKDDVDRVISGMAERNKMTPDEFAEHVAKMGANITAMRERIKASLSWADVIRRRFGHQISLAGRDIDQLASTFAGQEEVSLQLHRILIPVAAKADQKLMASRLRDAEQIRAGFSDCSRTPQLAAAVSGARFDDLGERRPATIPEPTRSLLMNASANQMVPPTIGAGGVELWAVCGRKTVKAEDQKRKSAKEDSRQKEFEILAKKHLKDLRQDAHIEYR